MTDHEKLKFIQRVLEGHPPQSDIDAAAQMARDLRRTLYSQGAIFMTTAGPRYRHRDGFSGSASGAEYVEMQGNIAKYVWKDGTEKTFEGIYTKADIDSWVRMGWWIPL